MAHDYNEKLVWLLTGAAIGAAVALLYAPQSGRDTRRLIQRKTREGQKAVTETSRDLMDKGRELYDKGLRVADQAAEMMERGRRIIEG